MARTKGEADLRERIREALIDLCAERGYRDLSPAEVCRRAGVDRAAFAALYADLDDCLASVYAEELAEYERRAEAARAGLEDWADRVRATAYALYRFLAESEARLHFHMVELRAAPEAVLLLQQQAMEEMFDLIDEGRAELIDPYSLSRASAEQIGGGIFAQIFLASGHGGPMPPESEIVPRLMYAAVLPYLGAQRAMRELEIPPPPRPDPGERG